jgi:hypothetical protein
VVIPTAEDICLRQSLVRIDFVLPAEAADHNEEMQV